jgi:hypothetical protein
MKTPDAFAAALSAFVADYSAKTAAYYAEHYKFSEPESFSVDAGSKNIRIVRTRMSDGKPVGRSVACFVRKSDGAILKAAGWKAPFIAKGGPMDAWTVRGSIFDPKTWTPAKWA